MPDRFDYSKLSDAQLEAIAAGQPAAPPAPAPGGFDYSKLSEEELARLAPPEQPAAAPAQAGFITGGPQGSGRELRPASAGESLLRGSTAYGTFNFGDEATAALGAGLYGIAKGVRAVLPGGVPEGALSVGEVRRRILEGERVGNESAAAAHPVYYHGAGLLTSAGLAPGVAEVGALPAAARMAALAKAGAITGGLSGAGLAEGDLLDRVGSGARGAIVGALVAPAVSAGTQALARLSGSAAEGFRRAAGYAASRIAGGIQRDVAKVGGARAFAEAGSEAVERGLVRPWDFLPGADSRMAQRVADFARNSTDEITQALDDVGARVPVAPLKQALIDASDELRVFAEANPGSLSRVDGIIAGLERQADAAGTVSARTLQTAKKVINDITKTWDPFAKSSLAQTLNKAMYGAVAEAQEQAVETASSATGRAAYEAAKRASALAQKLEIFQDSAERRAANALSSVGGLTGQLGATGGILHALQTGDVIGGLGAYVGTRVLTSPRTATIGARAAERIARALPAYAASPLSPLASRGAAQVLVDRLR